MRLHGPAVAEVLEVAVLLPEVLDHRVDRLVADLEELRYPGGLHYRPSEICIRAVGQYNDGSPHIVRQLPPQGLGRHGLHGLRCFGNLAGPLPLRAVLLHLGKG